VKLNLFPSDAKFFEIFDQQAALIEDMCKAFKDFLNDHNDLETKVAQLTEMEHRGDELFHELSRRLNATFVTPIDREDIHAMGSSMDDVLDLIQGSATRMQMFQCGDVKPCLLEMADIMVECSGILRQGIKRLPKFQDLSDLRKPLKALESRGDRINRQAVADLFSHCQTVADIVDLIKWKEVIENVEDAIDKFEDVFDVIENVVVKHA
jgi:predicted phosphate transport protein (TIGR00153 family)